MFRILMITDKFSTLLHGLQRAQIDQLLESQFAVFRHISWRPVHKNPVTLLPLDHATPVEAALHIVHECLHAAVDLSHEVRVARIEVVVVDGVEPEERVVKDGVDVLLHGVFAAQCPDGAPDHGRVEEGVVVHQVRLYGIAAPHPAVALDALYHHLAVGQVQGVGSHLPDAVEQGVAALEGATLLHGLHL